MEGKKKNSLGNFLLSLRVHDLSKRNIEYNYIGELKSMFLIFR